MLRACVGFFFFLVILSHCSLVFVVYCMATGKAKFS